MSKTSTPIYDAVKKHQGFDPAQLREPWSIQAAEKRIAQVDSKV